MAPISSELGKSLDDLKSAVKKAEKWLFGQPSALGEAVYVDAVTPEGESSRDYFLEFTAKGLWEFSCLEEDGSDGTYHQHILEMPIKRRMKFARAIPTLIERVREETDQLPAMIDELKIEIEQSLAEE